MITLPLQFPKQLKRTKPFFSVLRQLLLLLSVIVTIQRARLVDSLRLNTAMWQITHNLLLEPPTNIFSLFTSSNGQLILPGKVASIADLLTRNSEQISIDSYKALLTLYLAGGMLPDALQIADKLQATTQLTNIDQYRQGFIYYHTGQIKKSFVLWEQSGALQKEVFLKQGDIFVQEGELERAKLYYETTLAMLPTANVYVRLAGLAVIVGDSKLAFDYAEQALTTAKPEYIRDDLTGLTRLVDGRFIWVYILLAQAAQASNDIASAAFWYQAATSTVESPLTLYQEGVFSCQVSQFPTGIQRLQSAIQRDPTDYYSIQAHYRLIDTCYCPSGDLAVALDAAQSLVAEQPTDETAQALLARLQTQGTQECKTR
ncbi:MAG: hypothetical protein WAU10_03010 [Caldilineaceae bacterium]